MANADKQSRDTTIYTPRCEWGWVSLVKPSLNFKKDAEEYSVMARFNRDNPAHAAFLATLSQAAQDSVSLARETLTAELDAAKTPDAKGKKRKALNELTSKAPYSERLDEDGNETNIVTIKFRCKAEFVSKRDGSVVKVKPPTITNRHGERAELGDRNIGAGSEGKIRAVMYPYYMAAENAAGVAFRLQAVQLLKLVEAGQGGSGSGLGFSVEEGEDWDGGSAADESGDSTGSARDF